MFFFFTTSDWSSGGSITFLGFWLVWGWDKEEEVAVCMFWRRECFFCVETRNGFLLKVIVQVQQISFDISFCHGVGLPGINKTVIHVCLGKSTCAATLSSLLVVFISAWLARLISWLIVTLVIYTEHWDLQDSRTQRGLAAENQRALLRGTLGLCWRRRTWWDHSSVSLRSPRPVWGRTSLGVPLHVTIALLWVKRWYCSAKIQTGLQRGLFHFILFSFCRLYYLFYLLSGPTTVHFLVTWFYSFFGWIWVNLKFSGG